MNTIEKAVQWAVGIANDNGHGYSQVNRWGPDYDCSSLVISAWQQAGVPVRDRGATYTGNMYGVFMCCGFVDVMASVNLKTCAGLRRGDVLLNHANHTAMSLGAGWIVHARSSEGNSIPGDQSSNEIREQPYYDYPWDCVLRYTGSESGADTATEHAPAADPPAEEREDLTIKRPRVLKEGPGGTVGSTGEAVRLLQTLLEFHGYKCANGGADGEFGRGTGDALQKFQAAHGLEADRVAGPKTWAQLEAVE